MNRRRNSLWILSAIFLVSRSTFAQTWTSTTAPSNYWQSVACSADGSKIIVAAGGQFYPGAIYISGNSGQTWISSSASSNNWNSVASSADGSRLLAAAYNGLLYSSTNFGVTWLTSNCISAYDVGVRVQIYVA